MKHCILSLMILLVACQQNSTRHSATALATAADPHTLSQPEKAFVTHLDLDLQVNFSTKELTGKASWIFNNPTASEYIYFDTRGLSIQKITEGTTGKALEYKFTNEDSILGKALQVRVGAAARQVNTYYTTSPGAGALQWLSPQQTGGKKHPFLLTQSEPILARSWIPCQDGPAIRFTYNAIVRVPSELMAVMSAENPQEKNDSGVYMFRQSKPIPSYLLALAVGDLAFSPLDARTGIYAEPSMLKQAVYEFADMPRMVHTAEGLYGPYKWGRYDVLVLPPSFPYGGMENPNLTFLTPTVIAGDRSLVSVVAHELAHSWSGNLVTNATWNDMWLNEGFTTYFERRIVEALYGVEEARMQEVLGRQALDAAIAEKGSSNKDTKLKGDFAGRDPDGGISDIEYEKGYFFIRTVEEAAGRNRLDSFLKSYFADHAFHSLTTEQFVESLNSGLIKGDSSLSAKIRVDEWMYQTGIPDNIPASRSADFMKLDTVISMFRERPLTSAKPFVQSTNQQLYLLSHLPTDLSVAEMKALDNLFGFTASKNAEVQTAWYGLAIRHQYTPAYPAMEAFLTHVGRRKFLVPLYKELSTTPEGKEYATKIYQRARPNYHPVAYNTIDGMLNYE